MLFYFLIKLRNPRIVIQQLPYLHPIFWVNRQTAFVVYHPLIDSPGLPLPICAAEPVSPDCTPTALAASTAYWMATRTLESTACRLSAADSSGTSAATELSQYPSQIAASIAQHFCFRGGPFMLNRLPLAAIRARFGSTLPSLPSLTSRLTIPPVTDLLNSSTATLMR